MLKFYCRALMYLQLVLILAASSLVSAKRYKGPYTCYDCQGNACNSTKVKTCHGAIQCISSRELVDKEHYISRKRCLTSEFVKIAVCDYSYNFTTQVVKCCEGNLCNDKFPSIPDHWYPSPNVENEQLDAKEIISLFKDYQLTVILSVMAFIIALVAVCVYIKLVILRRRNVIIEGYDNPALHDSSDDDILASASSSCKLTLHQRCIAQDVTIIDLIGKGRFGAVFRGLLHGENVAVKVFSTWNEASWKSEVNIYTNIALYHENVLGFKGSVITNRCGVTEMWLLTAYHEQGSLYDYLSKNTITRKEMMGFVRCICSGLLHLHTEMFALRGKPSIAHRDLKTRNVLLTSYGTCVIADFGLAVVKSNEFPNTKEPINYKVGTKRYMAPEILDDSINIKNFESFKRTDIYAFGLILWEICSRCITDGAADAFHVAYHDCVPNDPSFEDMNKVICIDSKRPEIPSNWSSDEILNGMATLMKECWHKNPEIRCTVYRVKKILDKINVDMQQLQSTAQSVSVEPRASVTSIFPPIYNPQ